MKNSMAALFIAILTVNTVCAADVCSVRLQASTGTAPDRPWIVRSICTDPKLTGDNIVATVNPSVPGWEAAAVLITEQLSRRDFELKAGTGEENMIFVRK